jgi:Domain of unknown function (DUF4278)
MRCIYRGISYTVSSQFIATIETESSANFRGSSYRIRRAINSPITPLQNLMYRGVAYYSQPKTIERTSPVFS